MRVLVIDDRRTLAPPGATVTVHARSSKAAWPLLTLPWDEVWFDHDLGGDDTTVAVARRFEEASHGVGDPIDVGRCVVHTDNGVGADELMAALSRYDVARVNASMFTTAIDGTPVRAQP